MSRPFTRKPLEIVNHLESCAKFLQSQGHQNLEILGSFAAFMTGVQYHPRAEKPEQNQIYMCYPDRENKYDENAIGVYYAGFAADGKPAPVRMAWVPKELASHIMGLVQTTRGFTQILLTCFCTGPGNDRSAPCLYNVFGIRPNQVPNVVHT